MGMGEPFTPHRHQESRNRDSTNSTDKKIRRGAYVCSDPFDVLSLESDRRQTAGDESD